VQSIHPAETISIPDLRENLIDEIFKAAGFSESGWPRKVGGRLFTRPVDRFAAIVCRFDQVIGAEGFPAGAADALNSFSQHVEVRGAEALPFDGPLIIAGNHPGSLDGLCVLANLPRQDIRFVVSGVPVTESLPNARNYLVFAPGDKHERMLAIRSMIRHLQQGGCVLIFPSGRLDPDPDALPGAEQALDLWSPSLEILLRRVPAASVVVAITGGVLAPQVLNHPLTRLQKGWRRQKLAEFIQLSRMLSNPHAYDIHPRVTFSAPVVLSPPDPSSDKPEYLSRLIDYAKDTLKVHQSWQYKQSS
jgi:1-acyl-sn-glycerol-3-phosphate acyltransferase